MLGLDHHQHPERVEPLHQGVGHLRGEPFLHLGPVGESLHQPRQLRQAGHPPPGQVGDVGLAVEGDEMVLAQRVEGDVLHHHDLLVVLVAEEGVHLLGRVPVDALQDFGVVARHPLGGVGQALTVGILAHRLQDLAYRLLDSG